ncbi:hypothetical protein [Rhizobium sp. LjRoot254]|uniref:hypothetical protein n=1 Tax=Rhizobium sp. LjRoot254 TaxID=3342297 RepID=UPI003ECE6E99
MEIQNEVERLCDSNEAIDSRTLLNATRFIDFSDGRYPVADEVGQGYWPTICFSWTLQPQAIQIEIFEDRYEFYRFFDKKTEIRAVECGQDQEFPEPLKLLLDPILSAPVLKS